jgi:hypothetical protein
VEIMMRLNSYGTAMLMLSIALSAPQISHADTVNEQARQRFTLDGTRLVFDASVVGEDGYDGIDDPDAIELRAFLFEHPEIELLELNAEGGFVTAALDMAAVVVDYEIDTVVTGRCESACTLVFLAGANRTLAKGGRLGFHSASWSRDSLKDFYEQAQESRGWADEFAFASWVYEESIRDFNKKLEYKVSRGVDVEFIIRAAYVNNDDIWYPSREELVRYGLLR